MNARNLENEDKRERERGREFLRTRFTKDYFDENRIRETRLRRDKIEREHLIPSESDVSSED